MRFKEPLVALAIVGVLTGGCANYGTPVNKEVAGAGVGTLTGALLGYGLGRGHSDKEVAIVLGAFLGGVAGSKIGARLNEADRVIAARTLEDTLEHDRVGMTREWVNPDTGHGGTSAPVRTYTSDEGTPCREFTTTVIVGGNQEQAYGTACRQADGSWKIQP